MPSRVFDLMKDSTNPAFDQFGGKQKFMEQLSSFAQDFRQNGMTNPQQVVQSYLDSGRMTQAQFDVLRRIANSITGQNH